MTVEPAAMGFLFAPVVACRPALPSDTADVLEFTKLTWEGNDYIKYVWRDWLADPRGLLAAAVYGPRTVGIAKATVLTPGQWWLEGFRIDPKYQGLKIGSHLHEYLDAWWIEHGDGTLRLMTSSERVQVQHLCARTGFSKVGEAWAYRARAADESKHALEPASVSDVPEALAFCSRQLAGPLPLVDLGWRFAAPDAPLLTTLAQARQLHWWRGREGLAGLREDDDEQGRFLGIDFAACMPGSLTALLKDVVRLAKEGGYASALWLAPNDAALQAQMVAAGFVSEWDHSGFLYEKPHPRT